MICIRTAGPGRAYAAVMLRAIAALLTALPLAMTPATVARGMNAADGPGLAGALFAVAVALVLTLLLRRLAAQSMHAAAVIVGRLRLRKALLDYSGYVLSDFIVPGAYGGLSKVDHALLTPAGVVCIRAVHRHGKIFGSDDDAQWINVAGGQRQRFLNPRIQNEGRTRALVSVLAPTPVENLVVFTSGPRFAADRPANVIALSELGAWLDKFTLSAEAVDDGYAMQPLPTRTPAGTSRHRSASVRPAPAMIYTRPVRSKRSRADGIRRPDRSHSEPAGRLFHAGLYRRLLLLAGKTDQCQAVSLPAAAAVHLRDAGFYGQPAA